MIYIVTVIGVLVLFYLYSVYPGGCTDKQKEVFCGVNYAHRGLHSQDKTTPENSLLAFKAAAEAGYGIELDIQLSKDGQVVVFHDNDLQRVCGVQKKVCQLDYDQLAQLHLCGSAETIPLFTDVLKTIDEKVPVIVELKTGSRNSELCSKALDILNSYNGEFCIESFDPRIVAWFRRNAPDIFRGQLTASYKNFHSDSPAIRSFVLSHLLFNFLARPQFIAHGNEKKSLSVRLCEMQGAVRIVWTARDGNDAPRLQSENDSVIFEFYRPETRY